MGKLYLNNYSSRLKKELSSGKEPDLHTCMTHTHTHIQYIYNFIMVGLYISAALVGSIGMCSIPMIRAVMSKMTSIEKQGKGKTYNNSSLFLN